MARKTKTARLPERDGIVRDGILHLQTEDLLRIDRIQAKIRQCQAEEKSFRLEADAVKRAAADAVHSLNDRQRASQRRIVELTEELHPLMQSISERYRVDINGLAYDDITGALKTIAQGVEVPIRA